MKKIWIAVLAFYSLNALASGECAGRTTDGSFVLVRIDTSGGMALPAQGEVTIERGGNKFGYRFGRDDISQYFEFDDASNGSAMVGSAVYVRKEFPISLRYVGTNYVDQDLKAVIDSHQPDAKGNVLRVWKGPGHQGTDQYQITRVACSVWSNI